MAGFTFGPTGTHRKHGRHLVATDACHSEYVDRTPNLMMGALSSWCGLGGLIDRMQSSDHEEEPIGGCHSRPDFAGLLSSRPGCPFTS